LANLWPEWYHFFVEAYMLPGVGMDEMVVILVLVLILFGSKRLPELARGLGKGMREFRKAAEDVKREMDLTDDFKN
jgi:sec-independent protein translocase protein TatA